MKSTGSSNLKKEELEKTSVLSFIENKSTAIGAAFIFDDFSNNDFSTFL